jgi:hypothetical protein
MATAALVEHTREIRQEHDLLLGQLELLENALGRVQCYAEVYANFEGTGEASEIATRLLETVLRHFEHEERTILPALNRHYPSFVREMQRQHDAIRRLLQHFTTDLLYLGQAEDCEEAVRNLKEEGDDLARKMVAHMEAEERRYHLLQESSPEEDWGKCERLNV